MIEIERRLLLRGLPSGLEFGIKVRQGYINAGDPELRVRQQGEEFCFTLKAGEGFSRQENEVRISRDIFNRLWPLTKKKRIYKIRHMLSYGGLLWEIDEFYRWFERLVIAEVELPSEGTKFIIPPEISDLVISDITNDSRYRNKNLATQGFPK